MSNVFNKKQVIKLATLSVGVFSLLALSATSLSLNKEAHLTNAAGGSYIHGVLPSTIDLNDSSDAEIRAYYQAANNKNGNNLLISLKDILKTNQNYYSYDDSSNNKIWQMYEISDRDWDKSPLNEISGYNASTKIISGYTYKTSDPYVRALYVNRGPSDQNAKTAYAQHGGSRENDACIEREHIWPKSHGFDVKLDYGARGDPMHLLAADGKTNGAHLNHHYGYVDKNKVLKYNGDIETFTNNIIKVKGNYVGSSKTFSDYTGVVFEPQDCDKGDIARACFYMVARYNYLSGSDDHIIDANNPNLALASSISELSQPNGTSDESTPYYLGIMQDLLEWHRNDLPDAYEIHRNNILYKNYTKNRNPFIDFPEWAEYIWGNKKDQTTNVSTDPINKFNETVVTPVDLKGISVTPKSVTLNVNATTNLTVNYNPSNATNKNVTYSSNNETIASVSSLGEITAHQKGDAIISVTSEEGGFVDTCNVHVNEEITPPTPIPGDFKVTKEEPKLANPSNIQSGDYFIVAPSETGSLSYIDSTALTKTTHYVTGKAFDPTQVSTGYFKINKDNTNYTLSNADESLYLGYSTKSKSKTNFDVLSKPTSFGNEYKWTLSNNVKKFAVADSNLLTFISVNVTDRCLLENNSNTYKAYSTSNVNGASYSGLYLYEYQFTYDYLINKLKAMTCLDMESQAFHDDIVAKFTKLSPAEVNALSKEQIMCSSGEVLNAKKAYDYALARYELVNPSKLNFYFQNNSHLLITIVSVTSIVAISVLLIVYFNSKKKFGKK